MVYLVIVIAVVLVVVLGLTFVGSAVGKTSKMPPQIVVDVHEAINFCAEAVPVSVSSVLSYDDVRRLLRLHLEWLQAYHWAPEGDSDGPIVFEEYDSLDYVMERADIIGLDVERDHAAAVIEAHSSYLQVMGAIHIEDPVDVQADLAELPLLDAPLLEAGPAETDQLDEAPSSLDDHEDD